MNANQGDAQGFQNLQPWTSSLRVPRPTTYLLPTNTRASGTTSEAGVSEGTDSSSSTSKVKRNVICRVHESTTRQYYTTLLLFRPCFSCCRRRITGLATRERTKHSRRRYQNTQHTQNIYITVQAPDRQLAAQETLASSDIATGWNVAPQTQLKQPPTPLSFLPPPLPPNA